MERPTPADVATVAGGFLSALSIPLFILGYYDLGVRVLFAGYGFDVVDGWLARRYGSREDGFFLDRAYDRLSQVVAPGVLLLAWAPQDRLSAILYSFYFAGFAAMAYYRLVRRGVRSLAYFNGLPLFAHAAVILAAYISGWPPSPLLLYTMLAASSLPIPYYRRRAGSGNPSPATLGRLALVALLALAPYDNMLVETLAYAVIAAIIAYLALGPVLAWRELGGRTT